MKTATNPGRDRQQAIRATIALESMGIDWTHKKARVQAVRGLIDSLGIHQSTAYRILGDYMEAKMSASRQQYPGFWMFGQEARP